MQARRNGMAIGLAAAAVLAGPLAAAAGPKHPYLLWTRKDLAALRRKIETQPWAREAYRRMVASNERYGDEMRNLFRHAVMGDRAAGEREKRNLLSLLRSPDPLGASMEFHVLAYDVLYDELTAEQRRAVESRFRRYIRYAIKPGGTYDTSLYNNDRNYARYDGENGRYTRTNWLPNIIFPWKLSANLMAAAIGDEKLTRQTWAVHGSIGWYFDEYLGDSGFYSEEFSKMGSTPGALLLYCTAVRSLGLDELGFGYRGKGGGSAGPGRGATMRGHIESVLRITFPRVDLGTSRPRYPRVSAGDVRPWMPFEHATVEGYFRDGTGGNELWRAHGAWGGTTRGRNAQWDGGGKTEKMQTRLWFEWAHKLWPDAGFDYFLAQMRPPGEAVYTPTLYFGIDPVAASKVTPPAAPSGVYPDRGLVMLRADESPAYWASPAPAVCLRLTANYAHNVNDQLALCGFYAFNRPIYLNPKSDPGYAFYFSRSVRSHCSVMVDGHVKRDDWGKTGSIEPQFTDDCTARHAFAPEVKFVAARTKKRYEGVDETRALLLTRDYLFDVFSCRGEGPHSYVWIVHTWGRAEPDRPEAWKPSTDLAELIKDLSAERSLATGGESWGVTVRQAAPKQPPADSPLDDKWFSRKVGVRLRMLGQPDAKAYLTATPKPRSPRRGRLGEMAPVDGVTILASRRAASAAFVALHEPFEGEPRIRRFEPIARRGGALGVRVLGRAGSGVDDRLMLRLGDGHGEPVTLAGGGERFTFADYAFVRVGGETVTARGDLRAMSLRVGGGVTRLVVNGRAARATVADGLMTWQTQGGRTARTGR
jgi:hypothetical protein